MNSILDSFSLFITPFLPKRSFEKLSKAKLRGLITVFSFLLYFLITTLIFQLIWYPPSTLKLALIAGSGSLIRMLLISIIIEVLVFRIFKKNILLGYAFSVCSISSLPLILSQLARAFYGSKIIVITIISYLVCL